MKYTKSDFTLEFLNSRYPEVSRRRSYGQVSYAYRVSDSNPFLLMPNVDHIVFLEEAFDYIESGQSYRDVEPFLQESLLAPITYMTINNLYRKHRKPFVRKKTDRNKFPEQLKLSKKEKQFRTQKSKVTREVKKFQEMVEEKNKKKIEEGRIRPSDINSEGEVQKREEIKPINIVFKPHAGPQTDFLAANEQEVLYGGAAGGGKSYGLLADPMRYFSHPEFTGLILRRTNDELRELKNKSKLLYPKAFPGAKFSEVNSTWTFPSGATLWMTYLDRDDDVLRFQGQAYTWIGFDELTHWPTPYPWNYLRSRLRTTASDLPVFMRATTNPGGVGHHWVKKMFIDPAPYNKPFWMRDYETNEVLVDPETNEPLIRARFIPAKLSDNPSLSEDGQYRRNLLSLPEQQRKKLLDGDWSIVEGAAFPEFGNAHILPSDFEIPQEWRRFRACDYGYSSYSAVLWFAIDPGDRLYVYRELYVSKYGPEDLARKVLQLERGEKISYGVLDSSTWQKRGEGPSVAEIMIINGCHWRPSDRSKGSRAHGAVRLHEYLKVDRFTDEPSLFVLDNCRQLLADLPSIPSDPNGSDDIDVDFPNDHTYDALRYGIMSRPRAISAFEQWESGRPTGRMASYRPASRSFGY